MIKRLSSSTCQEERRFSSNHPQIFINRRSTQAAHPRQFADIHTSRYVRGIVQKTQSACLLSVQLLLLFGVGRPPPAGFLSALDIVEVVGSSPIDPTKPAGLVTRQGKTGEYPVFFCARSGSVGREWGGSEQATVWPESRPDRSGVEPQERALSTPPSQPDLSPGKERLENIRSFLLPVRG